MTFIYLVENINNSPFDVYIGKTKNSRENDHKRKFGSQIKYTIIDEIDSLNSKDWKPLECFWINYFKFLGFEILNKNKGGGGPSFRTEESKYRQSIKIKGKKQNLEHKEKRLKNSSKPRKDTSNMKHPKPWVKEQRSIHINQFDDNNILIKEWLSQQELIKNGFKGISGAIRDKRLYKGCFWKYKHF